MGARRLLGCIAVTALIAGACSNEPKETRKPMTTAQRDSAIGESKLPGAGVVKRAIEVSDSAETRAAQPVPEPR